MHDDLPKQVLSRRNESSGADVFFPLPELSVRLLDGDQHQYQTAKHIKHIKQPQDFHGIEIEILSTYPTYPLEPLFGHH